jgi:ribonuclease HII
MARLILGVDAIALRAIAGPVIAAGILLDAGLDEPVYELPSRSGVHRYKLTDAKKIPAAWLPSIEQHLKGMAIATAVVTTPASQVTSGRVAAWESMGRAAARTAERARHFNADRCAVGKDELELYIPDGGHCEYAVVGNVGQRPAQNAWQRGAATILARAAQLREIEQMHGDFPMFDFTNNLGNATPAHLKAIRKYGSTPYHRG